MKVARSLALWLILSSPARAQPEGPPPVPDKELDANAFGPGRIHLVRDTGGHTAIPRDLVFTPDGKKLVSTGDDRTVQVWDVLTRERLRVFRLPVGADGQGGLAPWPTLWGQRLVVDQQSEHVAFCGDARDSKGKLFLTTYVCSLATGQTRVLKGSGSRAFSPDGKFLAIGTHHDVRLVEIDTDQTRHIVNLLPVTSKNHVLNLAYSPTGKTLAAVVEDARIYLLDGATLKRLKPLSVAGVSSIRHVSWADESTLVCRTFTKEMALIVVDAATGAVKHSYPTAVLLAYLPQEGNNQLVEIQALTGTTKAFVRTERNDHPRQSTSFVFDWNTGQAQSAYTRMSEFGCKSTAIAPDMKVAAQGDANSNDIMLWDPQTGKPFPVDKDVLRLRPAVRGALGRQYAIRWLLDGKGFLWEQRRDSPGMFALYHQIDLASLTRQPVSSATYNKVGRDNALRILGNAAPSKYSENFHLNDRGIRRSWESLSLNGAGNTVLSKAEPLILKEMRSVCQWDVTFVEGGRVAYHPWGGIHLDVFDAATGKLLQTSRPVRSHILSWAVSPEPANRYLLIGSADQTLTIYNTATNKVLLTFFPSAQDWIAWTPEGYYAATPGGERLMGWHVENGPDQLASFYPAERFRKRLYRPDVIKLVLEKGSVEEALKAADAELLKQGRAVKAGITDLNQLLPPRATLQILEQSSPGRVKVKASAVAAVPAQPVLALRLLVNGLPLPDRAGSSDKAEAVWDIALPPGKHLLTVVARSPDASASSAPVLLEVVGQLPGAGPQLHILSIGVDKYQQPGLQLNVAAKDATDLKDAFVLHCKGPLFREVAATSLLDAKATRQNIVAELAKLRQRVHSRNDLAVVYFAGHGVKEGNRFYLLPVDAKINKLADTALSGEVLRKALAEFPCQVLLILDACHTTAGLKAFRPAVDEVTRTLIDDDVGVAILCAAMANEEAQEGKKNGLFTRAIVQALRETDGVPFNRYDRRLYIHHLHSFVFDEVTKHSNDSQHPFLCLPAEVDFALRQLAPAVVPPGRTTP